MNKKIKSFIKKRDEELKKFIEDNFKELSLEQSLDMIIQVEKEIDVSPNSNLDNQFVALRLALYEYKGEV
ncbi:hypothetical protein [Lactococcus lactis]|uniref:Uncharacterized protein n=1 Tax=Lactococcus lactis subsp. lactis TaxID=1360 RepID=A0A2R7Y022_LACLL|nr:hypothetical protein [Lactococcus lactis]PUA16101.1 hypothetical protein CYU10_002311 [Lactococcus lactis subsp. lactis]WKF73045.1 hypothetical protein QYM42_11810 [Lactococcus lactis]